MLCAGLLYYFTCFFYNVGKFGFFFNKPVCVTCIFFVNSFFMYQLIHFFQLLCSVWIACRRFVLWSVAAPVLRYEQSSALLLKHCSCLALVKDLFFAVLLRCIMPYWFFYQYPLKLCGVCSWSVAGDLLQLLRFRSPVLPLWMIKMQLVLYALRAIRIVLPNIRFACSVQNRYWVAVPILYEHQ